MEKTSLSKKIAPTTSIVGAGGAIVNCMYAEVYETP
jgi:hypothetical protein